jgi:hypothetical protein
MKPTLIANPAEDGIFAVFAQVLVDHGATSIEELERRLRGIYPDATVHARELAGEPVLIWYVYRDGHWIHSRSAADNVRGKDQDAHSAGRPARDRGIDPQRRGSRQETRRGEGGA